MPPSNLLATVSRIVSNAAELLSQMGVVPKPQKKKPKPLHVVMWIHLISLFFTIFLGWIDLIPGSGSVSAIN